ncbi:hypothetical protein NXS98_09250 [Fontisphaera persica]|uniref:hypothetical protein n=1 Tax=Fontisphaera persica TaxID=2974023 RepID=UPI0024C06E03|nr:hypothetical protein [Fontisphaera persica]WCJ57916.1 hypothetical protein NXS98_09250 [Fontisphaera persica]
MSAANSPPSGMEQSTPPWGNFPFRLALAGGWIDQPFVSRLNPSPPGSMVVVAVQPVAPWMDRAGLATGTRTVARRLWQDRLPEGDPALLVRQLYDAENAGRSDPSGSQDMIGLLYPGINRLDYDARHEGGIFPCHIETCRDPAMAQWLAQVLHIIPIAPRPKGYHPLGKKNLEPDWVRRLGQTGKDCFAAILARDAAALGRSFNECMACWEHLLPHTVRHPSLTVDLCAILRYYQQRYPGAMYSGCGGGYLYIVSEKPVPGAFHPSLRI